jgi:hypothetical protein
MDQVNPMRRTSLQKNTGYLDFMAITEHNQKDAESGANRVTKTDRKNGILMAT